MNSPASSFYTFDSIKGENTTFSLRLSLCLSLSLVSVHHASPFCLTPFHKLKLVHLSSAKKVLFPPAIWRFFYIHNGSRKLHFMRFQVWAAAQCFMHVSELYAYGCKKKKRKKKKPGWSLTHKKPWIDFPLCYLFIYLLIF